MELSKDVIDDIKDRMSRFENKIDILSEAMMSMVRIEERQGQQSRALERLFSQVETLDSEVRSLKEQLSNNSLRIGFGQRVFWIVATGLLTGTLAVFVNNVWGT